MQRVLIVLIGLVAVALAAATKEKVPAAAAAKEKVPATLDECLAKEHNKTAEETIKAKWETLKTCAQKCFSGAGFAAPDTAKKQCFEAKQADAKSFWEGLQSSSQREANKEKFKTCITKTCSKTPLTTRPKSVENSTTHHVYNASSPFDRRRCATGLLFEVAKPTTKHNLTETQKTSLHTCLQACRTAEGFGAEEEAHSSQSSQQSPDEHGGLWRRHNHHRHHGCLTNFCTKANFETCKPAKDASLEAKVQQHELNEFKTTCACLQKAGGSKTVDCTQLKASDCAILFENEATKKPEERAKHSSSG